MYRKMARENLEAEHLWPKPPALFAVGTGFLVAVRLTPFES